MFKFDLIIFQTYYYDIRAFVPSIQKKLKNILVMSKMFLQKNI